MSSSSDRPPAAGDCAAGPGGLGAGATPDEPAGAHQASRRQNWLIRSWCAGITLLILYPVLAPGYVLSYDMVFVPRQVLLPWMLGLDAGLPRSVPQDALVSLISGPLPGELLQKSALLGALLLAGLGVARLLRGQPLWARLAGVTLAVWNPFVAERLVLGHWALLVTYGTLPWLIVAVRAARRGRPGAASRVVLWAALGSLVPTGGLLAAALAVPALLPGSALSAARRWGLAGALVLLNAPWWLPALLNQNATASDAAGVTVFALRSESWGGPLLTALGLGGVWNADAAPVTRQLPWIPLFAVALVALAVCGLAPLLRVLGRLLGWWVVGFAAAGVALAAGGAWSVTAPAVGWVVATVPGGGIFRDGQKWLAPLAVFVAVAAPLGLARLTARLREPGARPVILAVLALAPLAVLPDLAGGALGRLAPVHYPPSWDAVRQAIAEGPPGDAVSLPWSAFRRYPWNANRTVLDPAPRYMTRTVVADSDLAVGTAAGTVVVAGDDPRAAAVAAGLASGEPLAALLPGAGVRWVVEQTDQPGQLDPSRFAGLRLVVDGSGLRLWQVEGTVSERPPSGWLPLVVAVDVAALLAVGAAAAALARSRRSGLPGAEFAPDHDGSR